MVASIQNRTTEFRAVLKDAKRRQHTALGSANKKPLLTDAQRAEANGSPGIRARRSEFARKALEIGTGITNTMKTLQELASLVREKRLFGDKTTEIEQFTFVIKQDLASLNSQISELESVSRTVASGRKEDVEQQKEHNKNVTLLLQGKLADAGASFKEVLEVRSQNLIALRAHRANFASSASASSSIPVDPLKSASPLYNTPARSGTPANYTTSDSLHLNPTNGMNGAVQGDQQLLLMEEAQPQNTYIQKRGDAIEAIEKTINELGSIFGQLATMVSEQTEMIQRIDANTEDVVDNVEGAQRELMKYWSRVSGNRWLIAKMFGVLLVFFLIWVLVSG